MNSDLKNQVIKFVANSTNLDQSKIGLDTSLLGDLGVDGDDAGDFILAYAKAFEVDMTQFNFGDHFGTEGISPFQIPVFFWRIVRSLRGDDPHIIANKQPIMVKDLVRFAEEKRWAANSDLSSPHSPA